MSAQIASVSDLRNVLVDKRLAKVYALNLPSGAVAKGALSSSTVDKVRLALHRTVALVPLAHERVGRVHVRLREGRRELGDVHVMLEVRRDQVLHRPKLAERGEGLGAERVGREEEHRPVGELDRGLRGEASAADQQHNTARARGSAYRASTNGDEVSTTEGDGENGDSARVLELANHKRGVRRRRC